MRSMRLTLVIVTLLALGGHCGAAGVSKSQREAIIFVTNVNQGSSLERSFFGVAEFAAVTLARAALSRSYDRVTTIQSGNSNFASLHDTLATATGRTHIRAVDLIFVTHGLTGELLFADGSRPMAEVGSAILEKLTEAQRGKLRAVFSTASFGSAHAAAWTGSGFKAASGSRGIPGDSAASYGAFLEAWTGGTSFSGSVDAANASEPQRLSDNAAKQWFVGQDHADLANQVDSSRTVEGSGELTISTMP